MTLSRAGGRVRVAAITAGDLPALSTATEASQERITRWGPSGLDSLQTLVAEQGQGRLTFLVHVHPSLLVAAAGHGIAARINLNGIVRGRASSATLGYDAFDPYAGRSAPHSRAATGSRVRAATRGAWSSPTGGRCAAGQ